MREIIFRNESKICLFDKGDESIFNSATWRVFKHGKVFYLRAFVGKPKKLKKFHQMVLPAKEGFVIDHINGNGLDNRKENLRYVTLSQNAMNRSADFGKSVKSKGVAMAKNRFRAKIMVRGKSYSLGCFSTEIEAAQAYNKAALLHFGEYARLNVFDQTTDKVLD